MCLRSDELVPNDDLMARSSICSTYPSSHGDTYSTSFGLYPKDPRRHHLTTTTDEKCPDLPRLDIMGQVSFGDGTASGILFVYSFVRN